MAANDAFFLEVEGVCTRHRQSQSGRDLVPTPLPFFFFLFFVLTSRLEKSKERLSCLTKKNGWNERNLWKHIKKLNLEKEMIPPLPK